MPSRAGSTGPRIYHLLAGRPWVILTPEQFGQIVVRESSKPVPSRLHECSQIGTWFRSLFDTVALMTDNEFDHMPLYHSRDELAGGRAEESKDSDRTEATISKCLDYVNRPRYKHAAVDA